METERAKQRNEGENKMALFGASFSSPAAEFCSSCNLFFYLSSQVLQDSGRVDGSSGSDTSVACCAVLQVPMDTSDGELFDDESRN